MARKHRVLIIGLDGATLDLITPWAQEGLLPNLARLMQTGRAGQLRSVQPVVSAGAWSTFMTGVNPGKHGVYDFVYRESGGYRLRPTTMRDISYPTMWKLLSEQGYRVGVINVPMTYPPEPVNGFLVSGLGTPNYKNFSYPSELSDIMLRRGYRVNRKMYYPENDPGGFLEDTFDLIAGLQANALWLMKNNEWDLFVVVFRDTDDVAHGFWHYMDESHPQYIPNSPYRDAILRLYQQLDQYVGQLVQAAGKNTTVFVLSDHGFGPLYKDVFLNEWLRQQGYLIPAHIPTEHNILNRLGLTRSNISRTLRRLHLTKLEFWIKDLLGDKIDVLPRVEWPDFHTGIDWHRTRAYSYGYQGQIFINLEGREPNGIVQPGKEYETLLEELTQKLKAMRDPEDGRPVVDTIYYGRQLYHGPAQQFAPDLVLVMRNLAYITRLGFELGNQPGEIFAPSRVGETGGHRINGVLIAAGPGINAKAQQTQPSPWLGDITPTILHLLDASIPTWIDGRVLTDWLAPEIAARPIKYQAEDHPHIVPQEAQMSSQEEQELLERLSNLGYL